MEIDRAAEGAKILWRADDLRCRSSAMFHSLSESPFLSTYIILWSLLYFFLSVS